MGPAPNTPLEYRHTKQLRTIDRIVVQFQESSRTTQGINSRSFKSELKNGEARLTSAMFHPVLTQRPDDRADCSERRPARPPFLRLLPCTDSFRAAGVRQFRRLTLEQIKLEFIVGSSTDMASEATSRTNALCVRGPFQATTVASGVAERSAFRHAASSRGLHHECRLALNGKCVTDICDAEPVRRETLSEERFVRGNAPNIGVPHEKRNADQRSPAGREPDRRSRGQRPRRALC